MTSLIILHTAQLCSGHFKKLTCDLIKLIKLIKIYRKFNAIILEHNLIIYGGAGL